MVNHCYSIAAIFVCLLLGYGLNMLVPTMPAALFGLLLFAAALKLTLISPTRLESSIQWIIRNMGVCFVPAGVGIMEHVELIKINGVAMLTLTIITTLLMMWLVGYLFERFSHQSGSSAQPSD